MGTPEGGTETMRVAYGPDTDGTTREQKRRAVAAVVARFPDRTDHMPILEALMAPMNRVYVSWEPSPAVQARRKAWLERVREWMRAQGKVPFSTQISSAVQREYVAATGDAWSWADEEGE